MTYYTFVDSLIGPLLLTSDGTSLTRLNMDGQKYRSSIPADWIQDGSQAPFVEAANQLQAYFRGELKDFAVPLAPRGTEFQRRVWDELCRIPYGSTISYGELARRLENPGASRAVGLANGRNPIGIIVPCHRVIGSNGTLTGYAGGLEKKHTLLALEGVLVAPSKSSAPDPTLPFDEVS